MTRGNSKHPRQNIATTVNTLNTAAWNLDMFKILHKMPRSVCWHEPAEGAFCFEWGNVLIFFISSSEPTDYVQRKAHVQATSVTARNRQPTL